MSDQRPTDFALQDIIDPDWFIDSPTVAMPDPIGDFKREMQFRRDNPFEARWVVAQDGRKWLLLNVEMQDPSLLGFKSCDCVEVNDAPMHD